MTRSTTDFQFMKLVKFVLIGTFNTLGTWAIFVFCYSFLSFGTQTSLFVAYLAGFIFLLLSWTFIVFQSGGLTPRKVIGTILVMVFTYLIQSISLKLNSEFSFTHPAIVSLFVAILMVLPTYRLLGVYVHQKSPMKIRN